MERTEFRVMVGLICMALAILAMLFITIFRPQSEISQVFAPSEAEIASQKAEQNHQIVKSVAECRLKHLEADNGGEKCNQPDAYGTELKIQITISKESQRVVVTSAGPDRKFETPDDVADEAVKWNNARLIGKWAASTSKEAAKGFFDGWFSKSKFEESDEPEPPTESE